MVMASNNIKLNEISDEEFKRIIISMLKEIKQEKKINSKMNSQRT